MQRKLVSILWQNWQRQIYYKSYLTEGKEKKSEPDDDFKGTNLWNLYWNNFTDILQI